MENVTNILYPTWQNGTVDYQPNLFINLSNKNITRLTFDAGLANFTNFAGVIAPLFNGSTFTYQVDCAFPISGQYGPLPRALYYLLLVFALVLRRHIWLSTAALGTAMTYAATAAVHAIALNSKFKFHNTTNATITDPPTEFGDSDVYGVLPILMVACIMLTPILNWSITVRQNEARPVVVYWGLLMFTATIMVLVDIYGKFSYPLNFPSVATCAKDVAKGCIQDTTLKNANLTFSTTFYSNCGCTDFCGTIQNNAPFRKSQQMQFNGRPAKIGKLSDSNVVEDIGAINILFIALVIIQGIFGLVESQWSQAEVRNWIFRKLTSSQLHDRFFHKLEKQSEPPLKDQSLITRIYLTIARWMAIPFLATHRYYHSWIEGHPWLIKAHNAMKRFARACLFVYGKWTAASIYVIALFLALICPPLFISSVLINEINIRTFPYSEESDAVGQWGTWVGAFFVIFAALVIRYNSAFWHSVGTFYYTMVRFFRFVRGKGPLRYDRETSSADSSLLGELLKFLHECSKPFRHAWRSTTHAWNRTARELRDFREWWRDPVQHSTWDWVGGESGWWEGNLNNQELFKSWDDKDGWKAFQGGQRSPVMTKKESEDRKAERIAREKSRKAHKSKRKHEELSAEGKDSAVDMHSVPTTNPGSIRTSGDPQPPKAVVEPEDTQSVLEAHTTDVAPFKASQDLAGQNADAPSKNVPRKEVPTRRDSELPALPPEASDHEAPPTTAESLATEQGSFVPTALTSPPTARRHQSDIVPPVSIYNTQMNRNPTTASRRSSGTRRQPSDVPPVDDPSTSKLDSPSN